MIVEPRQAKLNNLSLIGYAKRYQSSNEIIKKLRIRIRDEKSKMWKTFFTEIKVLAEFYAEAIDKWIRINDAQKKTDT